MGFFKEKIETFSPLDLLVEQIDLSGFELEDSEEFVEIPFTLDGTAKEIKDGSPDNR